MKFSIRVRKRDFWDAIHDAPCDWLEQGLEFIDLESLIRAVIDVDSEKVSDSSRELVNQLVFLYGHVDPDYEPWAFVEVDDES